MRQSLLAGLVVTGVTAAMAAVPTAPLEPVTTGASMGTINIDENRVAASNAAPSGNPLWAVPLKELSATRERPIFSSSRRPLTASVAAVPYVPPPPKPAEPDRPQLSLVGTIAGDKEGFAIFLDRLANTVIKLRTGQEHKGWILRVVRSRETVMEKGDKTATLELPARPPAVPPYHVDEENNLKRSGR
jgi:general secretion pathway protein N